MNGGFGGAPKFHSPAQTTHFLARYAASHLSHLNASSEDKKNAQAARDVAVYSMVKIYNGGIRDVVGGGFSRYSVDERWHVPHCAYAPFLQYTHTHNCSYLLPQSRKCCTYSKTS